jgi:hypothetical protein
MELWLSRSLFSRTFSFFMMEFWLSRSFFHELFLFSWWNSGYHEAFFTNFSFSWWNSRNTQFGGRLFLYTYHKEYLHRIRLIKNLTSWFIAPFARKRVWSSLF